MIWRGSSVDLSRARPSSFPRARLASARRRWHSYTGATRDRRDTFLPVSRLLALPRAPSIGGSFCSPVAKGMLPAQAERSRVTGFGPRPSPLTSRIPPASLDASSLDSRTGTSSSPLSLSLLLSLLSPFPPFPVVRLSAAPIPVLRRPSSSRFLLPAHTLSSLAV